MPRVGTHPDTGSSTLQSSLVPLPPPLTAAPSPRSAAATPPRPPRRARERRWAPSAGVSPVARYCRRWAAGWRRPAAPSPRATGWFSPSRRAAPAAATSPSPPGKSGTGYLLAALAPGWGYRAGRCRPRFQHRRGGQRHRRAAPGHRYRHRESARCQRLLRNRPLCHHPCCSGSGMSIPCTGCHCPCHPCLPNPVPVPITPVPITSILVTSVPITRPCPHPLSSSSSSPPCPHPLSQPGVTAGWPVPARR